MKGDLLDSVFGHERSDSLQTELSAAIRNRELLHAQLLQRKSRLQVTNQKTTSLFKCVTSSYHYSLCELFQHIKCPYGVQLSLFLTVSKCNNNYIIIYCT